MFVRVRKTLVRGKEGRKEMMSPHTPTGLWAQELSIPEIWLWVNGMQVVGSP